MQIKRLRALTVAIVAGLGLPLALLWLLGVGPVLIVQAYDGQEYQQIVPSRNIPKTQAGTGVIRVAITGTDTPSCGSVITPCLTVQFAVDEALGGEEVHIASGVYPGVQNRAGLTQTVYISKNIILRGGYNVTNWTVSDPVANPTTLDAQSGGRVFYIAGAGINVGIENLEITGGNATGLGGDAGGGGFDAGGGLYAITATVTLTNTIVNNNVASSVPATWGLGGGVHVANGQVNLISNTIEFNQANTFGYGHGGGVYLYDAPTTLTGNMVMTNTGSPVDDGLGGGLFATATGPISLTITDSTFQDNVACNSIGFCDGGGLHLEPFISAVLTNNIIRDNTANLGSGDGDGGGLSINFTTARLYGNQIVNNTAGSTLGSDGGGIRDFGMSILTMEKDLVWYNNAGKGSGLYLATATQSVLTNVVVADNNLIAGGQAAIYVEAASLTGKHLTLARNSGGDSSAVLATDNSPIIGRAYLTNTIIVSHTVGITLPSTYGEVNEAQLDGVLWFGNVTNTTPGTGTLTVTNEITGDPAFDIDGYHLTNVSIAINNGINAGVLTDIDGDSRPQDGIPDLGADETLAAGVDNCYARINAGTVFTSTDAAAVQDAVDAAVINDTVKVAGYCAGVQIRSSLTQTVYISKNLTIRGGYTPTNWAASYPITQPTILDAQSNGRVVHITGAGVEATLESLELTGGQTIGVNDGGGIYIAGGATAAISNSQIISNTASDNGGGIYNAGSTVLLTNTIVSSNTANNSGGGLVNELNGTTTLTNSNINNNTAVAGGGLVNGGDLTLFDSNVNNNKATGALGGGGIYNSTVAAKLTLNNSSVSGNTATSATGNGGGIFGFNGAITLTNNSTVDNNTAGTGGGIALNLGFVTLINSYVSSNVATGTLGGGGIYGFGDVTLTNSSIDNNTATNGGGLYNRGFLTLDSGSIIISNTAGINGGGLYNSGLGGMATVSGTTIVSNTAGNMGGGIFNITGTITVNDSLVTLNRATSVSGGGIYNDRNGTMMLTGSAVSANTAGMDGGGIFSNGNLTLTGGNTVTSNTAASGGGIYNADSSAVATVVDTTISDNWANDYGGGVRVTSGTMELINVTVSGNTANSQDGGGIKVYIGAALTLTHATVSSNTSAGGSGIDNENGTVTVKNSIIANNLGGSDCNVVIGTINSAGHNLIGDVSCSAVFTAMGDITNTTPLLGPLQDNGGYATPLGIIETHALQPGSPAIDAATCLSDPTTDQRGESRPGAGSTFCDIGAFEEQGIAVDLDIAKTVIPITAAPGDTITYTINFVNIGNGVAADVIITDSVPVSLTNLSVVSSGVALTRTTVQTLEVFETSKVLAGQGGIITITGQIALTTTPDIFTNTVEITGTGDITPNNNVASAGVTVTSVPKMVAISPASNTHTATVASTVSITYDQNMDSATVSTQTFAVHAMMTGQLTQTYGVNGGRISLTPANAFKPGELVQASATTGTLNITGTGPIRPVVWQFWAAMGVGPGTFGRSGNNFGPGNDRSKSVAIGDVDGDGDLDLAVGNVNNTQNVIYLNDGGLQGGTLGTFTTITNTFGPGSDDTRDVAFGDVDGDGDLDLAVGNAFQQNRVYLNDGDGTFDTTFYNFGSGNDQTTGVTFGDVDGDGDLDLVVGNYFEQNVVYLNDGDGMFNTFSYNFGPGTDRTTSVAVGDVDGDGDLDLIVGNNIQQNVVYLNNGGLQGGTLGTFDTITNTFGPNNDNTYSVAIGDVDGDNDLDLAVGNYSEQNVVYLNDGDGTFDTISYNFGLGNDNTYSVAIGDVDGDGDLDLAVGNWSGQNVVHLNDGDGTFDTTTNTFGPSNDNTYSVTFGDVDGDGDLDLAVGNWSEQNVVYLNHQVDLEIKKTVSPAIVAPGQPITYTLTITNYGPDTTMGIIITDIMPISVTNLISSASEVTVTGQAVGVAYTWAISDISAGRVGVITISGQIALTTTPGVFTNTAAITTTSPDSDITNNTSSVGVTVVTADICQARINGSGPIYSSVDASAVQQAIDASNSNSDVIYIAGYCAGVQTRAGFTQTVYISKSLTLRGGYTTTNWAISDSVANPTTLDAVGLGRVVFLINTVSVTVENLRLINGSATTGGGVYVDANVITVVISNSQVFSNTSSGVGGGIYNNSIMTLNASQVSSNNSTFNSGGGIYNGISSTATLIGTTVSSNTAWSFGGGLYNQGNLTLSAGSAVISNTANSGSGGIHNMGGGQLTLIDATVDLNKANGVGLGGGILNRDNGSVLTLTNSTVSRNQAGGEGGGIVNYLSAAATLINSTVSSNKANGGSGGGGIYNGSTLVLTNTTISYNDAITGGGFRTGIAGSQVILKNSIVALNTNNDCSIFGGSLNSAGYNLIGDSSCSANFIATGDITNTNPLLGPLQNNGGNTETHDLLPGSPAIDAGDPGFTSPPNFDQRGSGFPRVFGPRIDIGAIESTFTLTLTVNTTNDVDDGSCTDAHCSLREAINTSNADTGVTNTIVFSIPGAGPHIIMPGIALPNITDPVIIDGSTQPGASCATWPPTLMIELDGINVSGNAGLDIDAGNTTVRGLAIHDFGLEGIRLDVKGGNVLECNFIGTDAGGTVNLGNASDGIRISGTANNIIGNVWPGSGNLIAGNQSGILLDGAGAISNTIQGNYIGTDIGGTLDFGNAQDGVRVNSGAGNVIGNLGTLGGNLISGNDGQGVFINGVNAAGNVIHFNRIGTNITGTAIISNGANGIAIDNSPNAVITNNLVSGNGQNGIAVSGATATTNTVRGNRIGTDISGVISLGNSEAGVLIQSGASNNLIGGTTASSVNQISGNGTDGIILDGVATTLNLIQGNIIGLDAVSGALGNGGYGIKISNDATNNSIGGPGTAGNTIAFNSNAGVAVISGTNNTISSNSIFNNTGLGIDLEPAGVTPNDTGDSDPGANNLQNFPVLSSVVINGGNIDIAGTLNSAANTTFTLEFFATLPCDPSGYGEGEEFLITDTVTTNGSGNAAFSLSTAVPAAGSAALIVATATDPNGNTSEFSECVLPSFPADLSISKTINTPLITTRSQIVTYTVTFANNGPGVANNVVITDVVPLPTVTVTGIVSSGAAIVQSGGPSIYTFDIASLSPGASGVITITAQVNNSIAYGTFTNTVDITSAATDPITTNNTAQIATTVDVPIEVFIYEANESTDVTEGGTTDSYDLYLASAPTAPVTITVSPDAQLNVAPTQLVFDSANWYIAQTVVVTAVDDFFAEPTPHPGIINHSAASLDSLYNGLSIISLMAYITDNDSPGIVVIQSDGDTQVAEGGATDTYQVFLSSAPASTVDINITTDSQVFVLPTVLTFTATNWFTPQTVIVGAVQDTIPEYFHTGLLTNTSASLDSIYDNNVISITAAITDDDVAADLGVVKTDSPDPVVVGQQLTYVITVTNNGPWPATNLFITDTLPVLSAGVMALEIPPVKYTIEFDPPRPLGNGISAAGISCSQVGNIFSCHVDDLAPGATMVLNLQMTPNSTGKLINTVEVSAAEFDPVSSNNKATTTTDVVIASIDLSISKIRSSGSVLVGETLVYTLNVANSGPATAFGVNLVDPLPANLIIGPVSTNRGSCNTTSGTVNCGLGTMASGATAQVTIPVTPTTAFTTPTVVTNTADVTAIIGTDTVTNNNTSSIAVTVNPVTANLGLTKTVSTGSILVGQSLVYTLDVTNAGPDPATGVIVTDALPGQVQLASATASQGSCSGTSTVICNLGTVSVAGAQITLVVTPTSAGTIINVAGVASGFITDPLPGNNTSNQTVTTATEPSPDLSLNKSAVASLTVGNSLTYTLTITNAPGADPATGVTLIDTLPANVLFGSATGGSCNEAGGTVTCNLGNIDPGDTQQVALVVTPTTVATLTNTASVAATFGADANLADNTSTVTTTIVALEGIITNPDGGQVTYTDPQGNSTQVNVPSNAVTNTIKLVYTPLTGPSTSSPSGTAPAGHTFTLEAFTYPGEALLPGYVFSRPFTITITYSDNDVSNISDEDGLILYYLDGATWADVAATCTPTSTYQRLTGANTIAVGICHLTEFGLFGPASSGSVYLPIILKNSS